MTQKDEVRLDGHQIETASKALADSVVALSTRGQIEDIENEATSIAKALVAGLLVIQASCSDR